MSNFFDRLHQIGERGLNRKQGCGWILHGDWDGLNPEVDLSIKVQCSSEIAVSKRGPFEDAGHRHLGADNRQMSDSKPLLVPTKIPWNDLKGKQLEECVYWLLHSMGARELQWRLGGKGQGAADHGRDLEASFYIPDPDGEMVQQRWWIEAKGRTATVEKDAVTSAVHNASAFGDVDVIVCVTNTQFSNPTIDWVSSWNKQKARPKIRLWDRSTLERHLSANPSVVGRFFLQALSPQGRLNMLREQFWNYGHLADISTLRILWRDRKKLTWDDQASVAAIVSEVINGNVGERAWGLAFDSDSLRRAFEIALINGPGLLLRAHNVGTELGKYYEAMSYLLLNMLSKFKAAGVAALLKEVWQSTEDEILVPQQIQDLILQPMIGHLEEDLFDLCQRDCSRVLMKRKHLSDKQAETYWDRMRIREDESLEAKKEEDFFMEMTGADCNVGFSVSKRAGCPFLREKVVKLEDRIEALQKTILFRLGQFTENENDPLKKMLR